MTLARITLRPKNAPPLGAFIPVQAWNAFYTDWRATHSVRASRWPLDEAWPAFLRFAETNPRWPASSARDVEANHKSIAELLLMELIEEQAGLADPRAWIDGEDGGERRNAEELRDEASAVLEKLRAARAA